MSEIIDFKSETQADNQPMTDDEIRLANIYDVAVDYTMKGGEV